MSDQTSAEASDTATLADPGSTDAPDPLAAPAGDGRAWSSKPFRWLWAGSAVSFLGSEVGELAIPLLALISLDAGAGELSAMRTAQFAPFLPENLMFVGVFLVLALVANALAGLARVGERFFDLSPDLL